MHDYYKSVVNEMVVNACDVPVYEVVVKLQHSQFRILVYEEPDVEGQVVCQACLAGRHFVGVVGDDVELAEPFVIDQQRRPDFGTVQNIAMAIDVSDGFAHTRSCRVASSYRRLLPCRDRRLLRVGPRIPILRNVGSTPPDGTRRLDRHDR